MTIEQVYRVIVTREDGVWPADVPEADVPELEGARTYARTLPALDRAVREVVVMAAALLVERGLSVRDVAAILGISPQRVSQLTGTTKTAG
ncbi:MAG: helix-turn-helix domain-containing protein [Pseudonocardiaceae bacterium]